MDTATLPDRRITADAIALVPFAPVHLPGALALSREMSWPYRLEDWDFALRVGRGFALERAGAVIGTAAWFPDEADHATIGMIIVAGAAQGRGYGTRLVEALLGAAGPRTLLLNSTAEGRALYARYGFQPVGTVRQHQGPYRHSTAAAPDPGLRAITPDDLGAIAAFDRAATGFARRPLLERLLASGEGQVLLHDGAPAAYAITRPFGRGHVIGPVVAGSPDEARRLIAASLACLDGRFVRIDVPEGSGLSPWLTGIGLPQVGDALTMVRGALPPAGPARLFALANQSFH
ncbi:Acetyltransferase (GNAT) domain-containing protein [Methylobacterium sp. 174MFSha1.1]|uniref:GNAT family N-acetyltransferase n=1 Tax=Methylobacterium sp. 174MFSha1.1 TaxID=1502749 RepID=UPI0008EC6921|nr:GNAT family N-acetyltransferase [Methylobacterium sp. 174MFSha1.1]SFU34393.1 Acetyltransferase (GNAT) domain-containing protein [Methylobacterium sp. 174MFSha1.1]